MTGGQKISSRRTPSSGHRTRRGGAAVELALLLPLLILLGVGLADYGRIVHCTIALSNAVRTGAEYGSRKGFTDATRDQWEAEIVAAVREELTGTTGIDPNEIDIAIATTTDADSLVRVAVQGELPFVPVVAWPGLLDQVNLEQRVAIRRSR